MVWRIEWTEAAAKEFRKLNKSIQQDVRDYLIKRVLIADHPRLLGKALKSNLGGLWRYRMGDFRIICQIQDEQECLLVVRVAHRRKIYQ